MPPAVVKAFRKNEPELMDGRCNSGVPAQMGVAVASQQMRRLDPFPRLGRIERRLPGWSSHGYRVPAERGRPIGVIRRAKSSP
jgi:hypothetical protein